LRIEPTHHSRFGAWLQRLRDYVRV
jgi:hypothetical protein